MRPDGLLGIGRFARRAGLSIKLIRHYHETGVLIPRYVDPRSGYRYYSEDQVDELRRYRTLQALGMPLREVRELARGGFARDDVGGALRELRARTLDRLIGDAVRLSALEHLIAALDRASVSESADPAPPLPVVALAWVPDRTVLARRLSARTTADGDAGLAELASRLEPSAALEAATIWHDCGRAGDGVECTVVVPDSAVLHAEPDLRRVRLPGGLMAIVRHDGNRPLADAYLAGWQWLGSLDRRLAGPVREWVIRDGRGERIEIEFPLF